MPYRDRKERRTGGNPTAKIWAVFLVTLTTTLIGIHFNYRNFDALKSSLDQLASPGEKGNLISGILQDIIQAENNIHSYILTKDTLSRAQYRSRIAEARSAITQLKVLVQNDSAQLSRVEDLQSIFELKIHYLERFLRVKKLKQSALFTSEALDRISSEITDTAFIDMHLIRRELIKGETVPVAKEEVIVTPDEYRGLGGFLRKLLGRDKTRIDTIKVIEDSTLFYFYSEVDTSIVRDYFKDSTLVTVNKILTAVMERELKLQERISKNELRLMNQNRVFIQNIRKIIEELRYQEQLVATQQRQEALVVANKSTSTMLAIGSAGVLMCGFFVFLTLRDVTRSAHYRQRLEEEKSRAEALARVKEDFVSSISHEIRTPLHNISGFSSLLEETELDSTQAVYVKAIRESQSYLSGLVNNILDQAKLSSGQITIVPEEFDLRQVIDELITVYHSIAAVNGIALRADVTDKLDDLRLIGDALRIKQILNNLVSNSIKFTRQGEVVVTVDGEKSYDRFLLRITVSDTGIGIDPDKLDVIFKPFVQEKPAIERTFGGTGLGLSIAKNMVNAMDGTIEARNRDGGGSDFTVSLSLRWLEARIDTDDALPVHNKFFADGLVLVVEDDDWNAALLQEILKSRVRLIHVVHDAETALEYVAQQSPDLVLTDINMPGMNGAAFLAALRARNYQFPVVAMTAHMRGEKLNELQKLGFAEICRKPFTVRQIENILQTYLKVTSVAPEETSTSVNEPDLTLVREFAGDDDTLFHRLVVELIVNSKSQVQAFAEAIKTDDYIAIAGICHQMKTTYDTLRLFALSETMETIEVHAALNNRQRIIELAKEVCPDLVAIITGLERRYISIPY